MKYRLDKKDRFYVLTLSGFATEEAAIDYLKNVQAALMWVLLHTAISANAVFGHNI